jgi:hypothetical protein
VISLSVASGQHFRRKTTSDDPFEQIRDFAGLDPSFASRAFNLVSV